MDRGSSASVISARTIGTTPAPGQAEGAGQSGRLPTVIGKHEALDGIDEPGARRGADTVAAAGLGITLRRMSSGTIASSSRRAVKCVTLLWEGEAMAMPGGWERYQHYRSMASFRKDEAEMTRQGWHTQGFHVQEVSHGPLQRILRGPSHIEVDAHYLRADWPGIAGKSAR